MTFALRRIVTISISLVATVLLLVFSAQTFRMQHKREVLYPSPALTGVFLLSEINPNLAGTGGDTVVYVYDSGKPGGSVLILGGTHASEIAACITVVLMVENLSVDAGRVFLIPYANASGFTHNEPQEAHPQFLEFETAGGPRSFRFGARFTNPVHQWPDPDVYVQPYSGATLAGNETRNLNRSYPGVEDGNLTERVAWAITELIRRENIDLSFDLHESSPEYPVVDAIVASEASQDVASIATVTLQIDGWNFSLEPSPPNFRGLSHREWTDHTNTRPILLETACAVMGRLRGRTNAELAIVGKDENYVAAAENGLLFAAFDSEGIPIERRIGRHLAAISAIIDAFNSIVPERTVQIGGLPDPKALGGSGVGRYLASPR